MSKASIGHLCACLYVAVLAFSANSYYSLRAHVSATAVALWAFVLSFALLNVIHLPRLKLKKRSAEVWFILAGVFGSAIWLFISARHNARASTVSESVVTGAVPMLCALVGSLLFGSSRPSASFLSGAGFGFAGVFIMTVFGVGSFSFDLWGVLFALLLALCTALFFWFIKKCTAYAQNGVQLARRVAFWAIISTGAYWFLHGAEVGELTAILEPSLLVRVLVVCLIAPILTYLSCIYSVRTIGAVKFSGYLYASCVATTVVGAFIGGTYVSALTLLGVILAIIGITLSVKR